MARKTSQTGVDLIKRFEGCKLKAYKPVPTEQHWTIGYGHYGPDVKQGMTITHAQAENMLKKDLPKYEAYVNNPAYVPLTNQLTQNQFDVLVSFCYNCGPGNLKKLCAPGRTLAQIAQKLPEYNKAGGNVLKGLVTRRAAEQALFNKPDAATQSPPKEDKELDKVNLIINGVKVDGAVLIDGTVRVPLRGVGDNIEGAKVTWDNKTKTATLDTPKG
jgi:GH24 family phage-related lysozyme (muramidase)